MKALKLAGAFFLGILVCGLALAPAVFPVRTYEAWCGLRYGGAIPGAGGLLLTIAPCPGELRGGGQGPWILCTLTNTSSEPLVLVYPERPGFELSFEGAGEPVFDPSTQAVPVHRSVLPAGGKLAFPCDLSRWLRLEPGQHTIRARRVPAGHQGGLLCRSNRLTLTVP